MKSKVFLLNSFSGAFQIILNTILTFICIKYFIQYLGTYLYGVFSVLTIIGNINIFANIGFNYSLIKFLSGQGKCSESDLDIIVAFIILLTIIIPISTVLIIFNKFILISVFNIPNELYEESKILFILLICGNFLMLIGIVINSTLDAIQKIYINNSLQFLQSLLYWSFILIILKLGYSLKEIGIGIFISTFIWIVLQIYYMLKYWGFPNPSGLKSNFKRLLKKQLSYSFKIYFSSTINFFYEPLTKIIIANFVGVSYVGYFDIALKIKTGLWNLISKILHPLFPYIAQIKDKVKLSFIINDIQKKMLLFIIPLILCIFFAAEAGTYLWLGNSPKELSDGIKYTVSFFMLNVIGMPNYQYIILYKPKFTIIFQLTNVFANIILFYLLYKSLGYYAILISFNFSMLVTFMMTLYYQKKFLDSSIFDSTTYNIKLLILFLVGFSGGFIISNITTNHILIIIAIPLFFIISTIILFKLIGFFKKEDIAYYFKDAKGIGKIISLIFVKN